MHELNRQKLYLHKYVKCDNNVLISEIQSTSDLISSVETSCDSEDCGDLVLLSERQSLSWEYYNFHSHIKKISSCKI